VRLKRTHKAPHIDGVPRSKRQKPLTLLGRSEAKLPPSPSAALLETFPNPSRRPYWIRFETADFTSLCPVTGQVDFAQLRIEYIPAATCVETKSLKFYLASYRNHCAFNEAVANRILDDFVKACSPQQATITAEFAARGGIALTVHAVYPDSVGRDSTTTRTSGSTESRPTNRKSRRARR
jgi:7-cyano-7-deazaguanine reductase